MLARELGAEVVDQGGKGPAALAESALQRADADVEPTRDLCQARAALRQQCDDRGAHVVDLAIAAEPVEEPRRLALDDRLQARVGGSARIAGGGAGDLEDAARLIEAGRGADGALVVTELTEGGTGEASLDDLAAEPADALGQEREGIVAEMKWDPAGERDAERAIVRLVDQLEPAVPASW